jgi:hypothetical protein
LRDEKPVPKSSMAKLIAQGLADQVNLTDGESRIMPVAGGGFEQCYNAQAVVAEGSLLVVAVGVVQAANDKQQLEPMLNQRRDMTPPLELRPADHRRGRPQVGSDPQRPLCRRSD